MRMPTWRRRDPSVAEPKPSAHMADSRPNDRSRLVSVPWLAAAVLVALTAATLLLLQPSRHAVVPTRRTSADADRSRPMGAGSTQESEAALALANFRAQSAAGVPLTDIAAKLALLARHDRGQALAIATRLAHTPAEARQLLAGIVADWSKSDATEAWHWTVAAGTAYDVPGQPPLPAIVLAQVAAHRPAAVAALVAELLGRDRNHGDLNVAVLADQAVAALIDRGATAEAWAVIREWAGTPGGELLGREAFERIALATAQQAPADAARRLQDLPALPARNFALATVAGEWAKQDPRAALEWAQELKTDDGRSDVVRSTFAQWEQRDMPAAADWLAAHGENADYDPLIAELVADPRAVRTNLRATLSLVESIAEPKLREQGLESVVRRWSESDAPAAIRYISTNAKLSGDAKQRLLRSLVPPDDDPEG
jgi:hypothetical protein